jgi:hypothetical protein
MKQNITLSLDKSLVKQLRATAGRRAISVSALVSNALHEIGRRGETYEQARTRALALLEGPVHLGNARIRSREALHNRKDLRR